MSAGNLKTVATDSKEMFGGAGYVAAGHFGDGMWTSLGLPMRVSIKQDIFNQNLQNEIMQVAGDSIFQASQSGTITLTLRRHNVEQMASLFPVLTKRTDGGYGWNIKAGPVTPIGLHVRPSTEYGVEHSSSCWWIPVAIAQDIGEWVQKVENTDSANEDFPLTFRFGRMEQDFTPGTPQTIDPGGRMLYQGDTRSVVAETWETGLPFGFRKGYAGRVESLAYKPGSGNVSGSPGKGSVSVTFSPPTAEFRDSALTGYRILYREKGSTGAFAVIDNTNPAAVEDDLAQLTPNAIYEVRVAPLTAEGSGQQAAIEVFAGFSPTLSDVAITGPTTGTTNTPVTLRASYNSASIFDEIKYKWTARNNNTILIGDVNAPTIQVNRTTNGRAQVRLQIMVFGRGVTAQPGEMAQGSDNHNVDFS